MRWASMCSAQALSDCRSRCSTSGGASVYLHVRYRQYVQYINIYHGAGPGLQRLEVALRHVGPTFTRSTGSTSK